jgi:hypothetical protein
MFWASPITVSDCCAEHLIALVLAFCHICLVSIVQLFAKCCLTRLLQAACAESPAAAYIYGCLALAAALGIRLSFAHWLSMA